MVGVRIWSFAMMGHDIFFFLAIMWWRAKCQGVGRGRTGGREGGGIRQTTEPIGLRRMVTSAYVRQFFRTCPAVSITASCGAPHSSAVCCLVHDPKFQAVGVSLVYIVLLHFKNRLCFLKVPVFWMHVRTSTVGSSYCCHHDI